MPALRMEDRAKVADVCDGAPAADTACFFARNSAFRSSRDWRVARLLVVLTEPFSAGLELASARQAARMGVADANITVEGVCLVLGGNFMG